MWFKMMINKKKLLFKVVRCSGEWFNFLNYN